jgi:hypothetical protein
MQRRGRDGVSAVLLLTMWMLLQRHRCGHAVWKLPLAVSLLYSAVTRLSAGCPQDSRVYTISS